jgi:hypothetical protein
MSRLCAVISLLPIATLLAACASRSEAGSATSRSPASPSIVKGVTDSAAPVSSGSAPSPIIINPDVGESFQPLSNVPASALSPEEAWARYVRGFDGSHTRIPATARVQYGKLTGVRNSLSARTFAYSFAHTGCANSNPNFTPPPNWYCTEWIFLNPLSGRLIVETWQQVTPTPSR